LLADTPKASTPPEAFGSPAKRFTPRGQFPIVVRLNSEYLDKLSHQIDQDTRAAMADHRQRMLRFKRYYQLWRARTEPPRPGEEEKSNFVVPMVQWQVFAKWAREVNLLLGDDTEIIAKPVGPTDQKIVHKVGRYMTWRIFNSMKIVNDLAVFIFRKILFGRSIAYAPWVRETYIARENGQDVERVWYEGPGFVPLWPDEFIVPAEQVRCLHDFSWVVRKYRATPQQIKEGTRDGRYDAGLVRKYWDEIKGYAEGSISQHDSEGDEIQRDRDEYEGVLYEGGLSTKGTIQIYEWYGTCEVGGEEHELVCRFSPELHRILGYQDLRDLYPLSRRRRPFVESALIQDGSYWCAGFGELLEATERELTVNHNLFTEAGQFTVGPIVFFRPAAGFNPKSFQWEPGTAIPTEDPASVRPLQINFDPQYSILKEQVCLSIAERITGISDQTLGRALDRPTAPRTATGQIALLEEGNIRVSLDLTFLREDMACLLDHIWMLEQQLAPPNVWFRVTEEEAGGLFESSSGGAFMTSEERGGRYDFDIRFATSAYGREAERQRQLALYQLDLQNPLIASNPRAMWLITNKIHKAMGDDNFADIIPEPPDLDQPKNPNQEWAAILQGEDVMVHPMDYDELHLLRHQRQIEEEQQAPSPDWQAIDRMIGHILEHQKQQQQKKLMQAMAQQLAGRMADLAAQAPLLGQALFPQPQAPGAAPAEEGREESSPVDRMRGRLPITAPERPVSQ